MIKIVLTKKEFSLFSELCSFALLKINILEESLEQTRVEFLDEELYDQCFEHIEDKLINESMAFAPNRFKIDLLETLIDKFVRAA